MGPQGMGATGQLRRSRSEGKLLPRGHRVRSPRTQAGQLRGVRGDVDEGAPARTPRHARRRGNRRAGARQREGNLRHPRSGTGQLRSVLPSRQVLIRERTKPETIKTNLVTSPPTHVSPPVADDSNERTKSIPDPTN